MKPITTAPLPRVAAVGALLWCRIANGAPALTTDHGTPVATNQHSKTAGPDGGVLLEDFHLIQKLARFDRERIPERVVHARGAGAFGEFTSAGDFSNLTRAAMLSKTGKKTPMFVRFSTVIHGSGSPETVRDPRGFALKFYTEEGNWDIVGNDIPVFFIRDAIKFPDMVHALKPSPVTNRQDPNRIFDFFSHVPEATHMFTWLYADDGIPADYRHMNGHGVHAFKFVNANGEVRLVKFNWLTKQGQRHLTVEEAERIGGKDFGHATRDLYDAIGRGDHPRWTLTAQVLDPSTVGDLDFDALDATKVWPEAVAPSVTLGEFVLNRVPGNFYQASEQSAFDPGILPPGVEPSADRLLQGRLFSYADTQRYRLGANYLDLPVNRARVAVRSNNQDGALNGRETTGEVNYEPSITRATADAPALVASAAPLTGTTQQRRIAKEDDFTQAGERYRGLPAAARDRMVQNLGADLAAVRDQGVRQRMVGWFLAADDDLGTRLATAANVTPESARNAAQQFLATR